MQEKIGQLWLANQNLVLASRSKARKAMLIKAGVPIDPVPADIDEREIEARHGKECDAAQTALVLAGAKAIAVSERMPNRLILGSDQTLDVDGALFSKAKDYDEAKARLRMLSGRKHTLHSAYCFARNGVILRSDVRRAELAMRNISDDFIDAYINACERGILDSVGVYEIEGLGVQMFDSIDGDWFTVLGLPLGEVISFLRDEGWLLR